MAAILFICRHSEAINYDILASSEQVPKFTRRHLRTLLRWHRRDRNHRTFTEQSIPQTQDGNHVYRHHACFLVRPSPHFKAILLQTAIQELSRYSSDSGQSSKEMRCLLSRPQVSRLRGRLNAQRTATNIVVVVVHNFPITFISQLLQIHQPIHPLRQHQKGHTKSGQSDLVQT